LLILLLQNKECNAVKDSQFPYHPQPIAICFAALVFMGATIFMGNTALTNDSGLILDGFLHFDQDGASVFVG
jgi:hypothetical protein